ncbi:MAG: hypothetical protein IJY57_01580 [Clostridia bacterium]|nr:hypothetical protein [Clostridia bacterium]
MDRKERLEFLKNVKREEIRETLRKIRESKDFESGEWEKAKNYQAEVEMEIMELEGLSDKDYLKYLKSKEIENLLKRLKEDKFLKFIDNDDFLYANRNKKFTIEEKVAIIVHSTNQSLESKFDALESLAAKSKNKALNKKIALWIDYKKKMFEHVKAIDNGEEVFVVCNKPVNSPDNILPRVYRRLDDCLIGNADRIDIVKVIDKAVDESGKVIPRNTISFSDINYADVEHEYKNLSKEEKLEYIKVQLKNPFKPFTIISCSVYGGVAIVADSRDKKVKAQVEESKTRGRRDSWLNCEIPIYMFPNGWMYGDEYLNASCLYGEYDNLCDIKALTPTMEQKEYIKYLKKAIKENK